MVSTVCTSLKLRGLTIGSVVATQLFYMIRERWEYHAKEAVERIKLKRVERKTFKSILIKPRKDALF
jgi:hypothetical protein